MDFVFDISYSVDATDLKPRVFLFESLKEKSIFFYGALQELIGPCLLDYTVSHSISRLALC